VRLAVLLVVPLLVLPVEAELAAGVESLRLSHIVFKMRRLWGRRGLVCVLVGWWIIIICVTERDVVFVVVVV
jgi:hypothetical protein